MTRIDRERAQVYAAEIAAFDGTDLEHVVSVDIVARLIDRVVRHAWWPGGSVTTRPMRSDARSSVTRCVVDGPAGGAVQIGISSTQATAATAAHELAHAVAGVDHGHDATFRRAHLDVVSVMTNVDRAGGRGALHVDQLRRAYDSAGLVVGGRAWPAPPEPGGAIVL